AKRLEIEMTAFEPAESMAEKRLLCLRRRVVIDVVVGQGGIALPIAPREPAVIDEPLGTDQQGVTSVRRIRLVGRIARAHRSEGKHLPPPLAGSGEKLDKRVGLRAQVTDSERTRQRRRMEQDPAGARQPHGASLLDSLARGAWPFLPAPINRGMRI